MTKNLMLDFLREIRHSLNRFVSIFMIVAIGVAFFAGLRSSAPDMAYTMDNYYDEYNVMDVQIMSTMGLTEDDITEIAATEGVEAVQPGYFVDAICNVEGSETVFRLHDIPEGYADNPEDYINQLIVVEGRLPEKSDEIVVEKSNSIDSGIEVGDTLTFTSGTDTPITDDALKTDTFTVVGLVETPFYLTYEKGTSLINGLSIDMFAYIPIESFAYEGYYIDCMVKVAGASELNAFSDDAYADLITEVHDRLANLGVDRSQIRGDQIREIAQQQLDEGQKEYDEGVAEYNQKITEGEQELNDAYTQLLEGEGQLETSKETAQLKIDNAKEQIASGEEQLASAAQQIEAGKEALATAQSALNAAEDQYASMKSASAVYINRLAEMESYMGNVVSQMDSLNGLSGSTDSSTQAVYDQLLGQYHSLYNTVNSEYTQLKSLNVQISNSMSEIESTIATAKNTITKYKNQLAESQAQYDAAEAQLAAGKAQLAEGQNEMEVQIAEAESELESGWEEYNTGKADYETQKAEGQAQLDEAQAQLIEGKYSIAQIEDGSWYVLDRNSNYGFASYKSTVNSMAAIASMIPIFFLLVAVLVCMTTMTRMVSDERGVIGTYKALGYTDNAIAMRYILYVLVASLSGGVVGAVLGTKLFPYAVYNAWAAMYTQPKLMQTIHWGIMIACILITTVAMIATAYYTCHVELASVPAQLMRPKAPKVGKTILLERIPLIWNHLNFSQKVTMRNLFRYKKRMAMTIVGIMGCAALLLAGLGMNDTISKVVANQYGDIFRYDLSITAQSEEQAQELGEELLERDTVEGYTTIGGASVTIAYDKNSETVTLMTTDQPESISDYIMLRERASGQQLQLDDSGVVLTEKLAEQLKVSVGESVTVTDQNGISKNIPVTGITENYVFHYAYMSNEAYASYFYLGLDQSEILLKMTDDTQARDDMIKEMKANSDVVSVISYGELADDFNQTISAMKSIVLLIIVCAALLAFVVLYNLTNINVTERIREIATIKVLGFKGMEVAMYIYRENFLLTLIGALLGLGFGVGLHRMIMKSIEQTNIMFGYVISPLSYVEAVIMTCLFSIIVMIYMYPKLVNIPMVESLKSVE